MNEPDPHAGNTAIAAKLTALAHPARLQIVQHLAASGCCCCKDVVAQCDLAQSTVSQHLKILVDAGLVRFATDRQRSRYEIDREALGMLSQSLLGFTSACCAAQPKAET